MKKTFKSFFFTLVVLVIPALCQASSIILTNASPNHTITAGTDVRIYGTSTSNQIVLANGSKAELLNFPGQNSIQFQTGSNLFTVSRSGSVVTFQGSDGTFLKIPATTDVQTISFNDEESRILQIYNNQVMLDDQVIGSGNDPIHPAPCTYIISSTSGNFSSSGENSTVSVTASSSSCSWTTAENLTWVSLTPTSGTGSQSVTISASANTGAVRTGTITIAGRTYTINQEATGQSEVPESGIEVLFADSMTSESSEIQPYDYWYIGSDSGKTTLKHIYSKGGKVVFVQKLSAVADHKQFWFFVER
jgi:hypothetical protein